ncbi:ADP-ribosylation factor-like protein 9 [Thunnus maccoyii]|uniref:ADP-ribosylation factor-like protein 9 n=1 Tax=Thunnus maccoyii TaxID=8240 RepID=UPI001C4D1BE5|nr:ADP-ribosylation factor-like protein 9 [Thunnus maccoyii]
MSGWSRAGVLGASVALAGGLAYLIWDSVSSSREEDCEMEWRLGPDGQNSGDEEDRPPVGRTFVIAGETQNAPRPRPVVSGGARVLFLGLDGAGKSSLLHCLATGGCLEEDTKPTHGFNGISVYREDMHIEFLEIGGKEELRQYWHRYLCTANLLVFVVDSSKPHLLPVVKKHLHELLASDPYLPLMVLANKQDLPGACSIAELRDALSLSEAGDRMLFLLSTDMKTTELSSFIQQTRDLMIHMIYDRE